MTIVTGVCVSQNSGTFRQRRRRDWSVWISVCEESLPCCITGVPGCSQHSGELSDCLQTTLFNCVFNSK